MGQSGPRPLPGAGITGTTGQGTRHQPHQPAVPSRSCALRAPQTKYPNQPTSARHSTHFVSRGGQEGQNDTEQNPRSLLETQIIFCTKNSVQHGGAGFRERESIERTTPIRDFGTHALGVCARCTSSGAIPFISTPISGPVPVSDRLRPGRETGSLLAFGSGVLIVLVLF